MFIDAQSHYTWIYFLKSKSDAFIAFKLFLAMVKTQFTTKVKAIQTDWGGEYKTFSKFLAELGIKHRLTCPHTSHQNGSIE
uniref:Retrovirus-related Pol polyprotein from transposon TNT 1-94 n=1 Tax=Cajanus cajan TaxID=3821 RepID=A0A151UEI6_CAJCA